MPIAQDHSRDFKGAQASVGQEQGLNNAYSNPRIVVADETPAYSVAAQESESVISTQVIKKGDPHAAISSEEYMSSTSKKVANYDENSNEKEINETVGGEEAEIDRVPSAMLDKNVGKY